MYQTNTRVDAVQAPPIPEAWTWVEGIETAEPLIDVCQAVPASPPPDELLAHVAGRARDGSTARYTDIFGMAGLREALADDINALYGGDVGAADVMITAGCNQAFFNTMLALAGEGDQIVLPVPWYFNHEMTARMLGISVVPLCFRPDRQGVPDPEDARRLLSARTRAIVLVTPNNPTGAVYPPDVIHGFLEVARQAGCALVIDETYRDFLGTGSRPHDLFTDDGWRHTLVHLYSFSKVYCLTGYRVGAVVAGGRLQGALEKVCDCVQISPPHLGQEAALYGIRHLGSWRRRNAGVMSERAQALARAFTRNDLAWELVSAGAYFAYVRHPFRGRGAVEVARTLAVEDGLLTLPGSWFGPGQDDYIRLAFANLEADAMPVIAGRLARVGP